MKNSIDTPFLILAVMCIYALDPFAPFTNRGNITKSISITKLTY